MLRGTRIRVIAALVAAVAVAGIAAGCGSSSSTTSGGGGSSDLGLITPGTLTIGSDIPYPPFEQGKPPDYTGFDVNLMDAIAKKIDLRPKWVNTDFDTIFTALATGKFDLVAAAVTAYAPKGSPAYTKVQQRRRIVAFSKPYYDSLQSITINKSKRPNVKSVADVKGLRVAVQTATTGAFWAEEKLKPFGVKLVSFAKAPDRYAALEAGNVDAVVNDLPVSQDAVKSKPDLRVLVQIDTGEQYAFAVARDNRALLAAVNTALGALIKDGTYARLFKQYFPGQKPPAYASS
jgi:polar amino acid transport system substrate-binding protein